jgi:formylglycine-generating enzyme required for sulfatase activity
MLGSVLIAPACSTNDGPLEGFVLIEAGTFTMGSPDSELGHQSYETPHEVTLTRDFELMTTEVTQAEFRELMGDNPSSFVDCGDDCPVEQVNWREAAAYANAVSELEGVSLCYDCSDGSSGIVCQPSSSFATPYDCPGYRLPTAAEWEYAARAGDPRATYNGELTAVDETDTTLLAIAWFGGNAGETTHAVGAKEPNAWGLHDMLGNVWEWTSASSGPYPTGPVTDPTGGDQGARVLRGGAWLDEAEFVRAASTKSANVDERFHNLGFRLARTSP